MSARPAAAGVQRVRLPGSPPPGDPHQSRNEIMARPSGTRCASPWSTTGTCISRPVVRPLPAARWRPEPLSLRRRRNLTNVFSHGLSWHPRARNVRMCPQRQFPKRNPRLGRNRLGAPKRPSGRRSRFFHIRDARLLVARETAAGPRRPTVFSASNCAPTFLRTCEWSGYGRIIVQLWVLDSKTCNEAGDRCVEGFERASGASGGAWGHDVGEHGEYLLT